DGRVPGRPERRPRRIASEGALFATRVIRATLKCTQGIADCQIQCEQGVFGPPCDPVPQPGCCDPDDPSSNATFGACMDEAQAVCDEQTAKIDTYELNKQTHITLACEDLTSATSRTSSPASAVRSSVRSSIRSAPRWTREPPRRWPR